MSCQLTSPASEWLPLPQMSLFPLFYVICEFTEDTLYPLSTLFQSCREPSGCDKDSLLFWKTKFGEDRVLHF